VRAEDLYKGYLVDKRLLDKDPHFQSGCPSCHKGDAKGQTKEAAHKGLASRPSDNITVCAECHEPIAKSYKTSLHYTTAGLAHGISGRLSPGEKRVFDEKVFDKSCRSCHASCGDCHVKSPVISGVNTGLIKNHAFAKRDEGKTCALCHGGRVYPEFTGEYGGAADVHYQKGMVCLDCHKKSQSHGDGTSYATRQDMKDKPSCVACHKAGKEKTEKAKTSHAAHLGKVSCQACHASAPYRNCYDCHLGKGAQARPGFILGLDPRNRKTVTTLRVIPTARDTFKDAGIGMARYDNLPNYWNTSPHNIRKRTERTRSCEVCHEEKKDFLTKTTLIKNGSKANEGLIYAPKPLNK
jgi:hypothetical protein